jgi:glucosamine--fructose-6-phosphate aminotransferase (isomerizing)
MIIESALKSAHIMIEEIFEQPQAIEAFLTEGFAQVEQIAGSINSKGYEMVYLTGSGTSYYAGLAAQYALSALTRFVTSLIPASELPSWIPSKPTKKSLLIAVSQSGESSDVLAAAKAASKKGIDILAVTNTRNSPLVKISDYTMLTRAGQERSVTATKSHITQLMALFSLSAQLSEKDREPANLRKQLFRAPKLIRETIRSVNYRVRRLADEYRRQNFFFLLGSGPNYATALEGALKLKEACNVYAEGFASREFLHGPMQLVDKRTSLFFLLNENQVDSILNEIKSMRGFGASVFSICDKKDERLKESSNEVITVPEGFPTVFSSLIYIIPLQLFAYHSSVARGLNPDKPEKLDKVVR